jgi:hypothetical protein
MDLIVGIVCWITFCMKLLLVHEVSLIAEYKTEPLHVSANTGHYQKA